MKEKLIIIGLSGSLRSNSYNKAALYAAKEMLPKGVDLEILDISTLPFFNEDVEAEGIPQSVLDFKNKLNSADALLISTAEYSYSVPPVLKNALDWASLGPDLPLYGKPLAIMSATLGLFEGARAQYHLRHICVVLNMLPLNTPEVFIINASTMFSQEGKLTDSYCRASISKLMQALAETTRGTKQIFRYVK